jgi:NADH-quinone oxidoreductase subunit N
MNTYPLDELAVLIPLVAVAIAGLAALIADIWLPWSKPKVGLGYIALGGVILAALAAVVTWNTEAPRVVLGGSIAVSKSALVLAFAILAASGTAALYSMHYGVGTAIASGETYGLILLSTCGMLGLVVANDLATLFVALETLSIGVYSLTGVARQRARSAEGAMKYFILGAFSSGFLLYGIALVYAAGGTLRLDRLAETGFGDATQLGVVGTVLVLVGLLFKLGAVPFHAWVPDAYEGAPASVTGFMSVAVKAAALGAALKVLLALGAARALGAEAGGGLRFGWLFWAIAAATMIYGNAGAFTQSNPRRLLAYSGIAHTGYVLVGFVTIARFLDAKRGAGSIDLALTSLETAAHDASSGIVYYALGYGVANLAAFAVLCWLEQKGEDVEDVSRLAGLARQHPAAALCMTVAMISLAGIPGTAGFVSKLWVFRSAIAAGDTGLVVLGLLASALSLYYYMRIVVLMYMRAPGETVESRAWAGQGGGAPLTVLVDRWGARLAYGACAAVTIGLGLAPGRVLELAASAGKLF